MFDDEAVACRCSLADKLTERGDQNLSGPITAPVKLVSSWLYRARIARGLSQENFALRAGVAVPTYGRLERAGLGQKESRVSLGTFLRLVSVLNPEPGEIDELMRILRLSSADRAVPPAHQRAASSNLRKRSMVEHQCNLSNADRGTTEMPVSDIRFQGGVDCGVEQCTKRNI
ncbi:helix-turn-helix domain-containing protein [Microbacterium phyllosphaerae]|uniref:helix-turn-helix domain-containing protein n=1 Tax=Microbacterium phyllosphaerae TaxID=124798 RepID=UPI0035B5C0E1